MTAIELQPTATDIPSTMTVGVMTAPGTVELREVAVPRPGPGDVLVRIRATAICTWEQRTYGGVQANTFPFLGGHEMAGEVVALGPGVEPPPPGGPGAAAGLAVGSHVAVGYPSCGRCHWCLTGQDRACARHHAGAPRYGDAWGPGGFAEYKVHPADGVAVIGAAAWDVACLTEPLACAIHAARLLGVQPSREAVVIGAGVMGLLNVVALKVHGTRVIVTEVDGGRLELARRMGADEVVDGTSVDPVERVRELTDGRGAEFIVAAAGGARANKQAMAMLAPRGRFVVFASTHPDPALELRPNAVHSRETGVIGAMAADKADFYVASRLVRFGLVDLSPLLQATYPLVRLREALELAIQPGAYRVIVHP